MASINGIEAVELIASASPALALAVRQRGRWPVVEVAAGGPAVVNGIEGIAFVDASGAPVTPGVRTAYRLDSADPALALAARMRGQRPVVVVDSTGAVVPAGPGLSAPVLDWTSATGDATPEFNIDIDETVEAGDVITLQLASDAGFTSVLQAPTDTLDAGEIAASEIDLALTSLSNGTYYARAKVSRGGSDSAWSNTETVTIAADVTPTAFSFTDVTGATTSTQYTSDQITVAGIDGVADVSITGGTYSKNGGGYTSAAGTCVNGDTFTVRHTSSASASTATNTVLTIGGVSDTYTTTTAAGSAVTLTYTDNAVDASDTTLYTFTGRAIGTAAADRRIVVGVGQRNSGVGVTVAAVTIAGVAATSLGSVASSGVQNETSLWIAAVPTGTTGDIVVDITSTSISNRLGIGVWALYGAASSTPHDVDTSTADPAAVTLTIPNNGAALGYGLHVHSSLMTGAWTGLTERFDGAIEGTVGHSGADATFVTGGATALQVDWSATPSVGAGVIFASWGP